MFSAAKVALIFSQFFRAISAYEGDWPEQRLFEDLFEKRAYKKETAPFMKKFDQILEYDSALFNVTDDCCEYCRDNG